VLLAAALGVIAGVPTGVVSTWEVGTLVGIDVAVAVWALRIWTTVWPLDARQTSALAQREDPTRTTADLLLLTAAGTSLIAVGVVLVNTAPGGGSSDVRIALAVASVSLSWLLVHTVFTLRYARIYHAGDDGGVQFAGDERPTYRDFAYLAFTIGMTFQVSDQTLETREFRMAALRHGLLSFVFSTGIVATTINLVASLSSS
jgi:uncharacterized membrane protein